VSVENRSGKTYRDAKMKFIAGDVRRVAPRPQPMELARAMKAEAAGAAVMEEKAFFEYHMYTLQRPSTVADNEIKQLEMFAPVRGMKVDKKFLYQPNRMRWGGGVYNQQGFGLTVDKKVQVFIEFVNSEANKLGLPLPAGKVRVYKQDPDDKALEFVGEEQIDHTPRNETLSLQIGNAFDLVGERIQKHWETRGNNFIRETIEVKLRNQKKAGDVVIRVKEPMYRAKNWKITEKSHDFQQLDSHTVVFDVPVPAGQEVVVTFTVEYWW